MPPRWKPVVSEENELVYVDASEPQVDLTSYVTPLSGQAAPQAQGLSPPHGDELYSRTMTEGGVSTDWFMEWLHRDSNQTSLLLMLGVALSIAAGHEYIGAWLQAAIANPWQTLSGLAGIACIASAVYPWVLPLQEYVRAKRTKLETNVQVCGASPLRFEKFLDMASLTYVKLFYSFMLCGRRSACPL